MLDSDLGLVELAITGDFAHRLRLFTCSHSLSFEMLSQLDRSYIPSLARLSAVEFIQSNSDIKIYAAEVGSNIVGQRRFRIFDKIDPRIGRAGRGD